LAVWPVAPTGFSPAWNASTDPMRIALAAFLAVAFARTADAQAPRDTSAHVILAAGADGVKAVDLEPIAIRRGRRYSALRLPSTGEVAALNAIRRTAGPLTVLLHGTRVGTATPVERVSEETCGAVSARFTPMAEGAPFDGIATDRPAFVNRQPIVRRATFAEEKTLRGYLTRILRAHGVPARAAAHARMDDAFAVTVRAGEPPTLVGGASMDVDDDRNHGAFVVLEGGPGSYRLAYAAYTPPRRLEPDMRTLYDAADLDGDGTAELAVKSASWETWSYRILSRSGGRWRQVFAGGGGGCG
jgi:hypothetical protein